MNIEWNSAEYLALRTGSVRGAEVVVGGGGGPCDFSGVVVDDEVAFWGELVLGKVYQLLLSIRSLDRIRSVQLGWQQPTTSRQAICAREYRKVNSKN